MESRGIVEDEISPVDGTKKKKFVAEPGRVSPDSSTQSRSSVTPCTSTASVPSVSTPTSSTQSWSGPDETTKISSSSAREEGSTAKHYDTLPSSPTLSKTYENPKILSAENSQPMLSFPVSVMLNDSSSLSSPQTPTPSKHTSMAMQLSPHRAFPFAGPHHLHLGYAHAQIQQLLQTAAVAAAELGDKGPAQYCPLQLETSSPSENQVLQHHQVLQAIGLASHNLLVPGAQFSGEAVPDPAVLQARLSLLNSHLLHQNLLSLQERSFASYSGQVFNKQVFELNNKNIISQADHVDTVTPRKEGTEGVEKG